MDTGTCAYYQEENIYDDWEYIFGLFLYVDASALEPFRTYTYPVYV